jgi:hypothetical protein
MPAEHELEETVVGRSWSLLMASRDSNLSFETAEVLSRLSVKPNTAGCVSINCCNIATLLR